jgi:hypothetical protein
MEDSFRPEGTLTAPKFPEREINEAGALVISRKRVLQCRRRKQPSS